MRKLLLATAAFTGLLAPGAAQACTTDMSDRLGGYRTYISARDLVASDGVRLGSVGAILQQDRANLHRFRRPDRGDQRDDMFMSAQSRALIPRWVHDVSPRTAAAIRRGNVFVTVEVYEGCIDVTLG